MPAATTFHDLVSITSRWTFETLCASTCSFDLSYPLAFGIQNNQKGSPSNR